MLNYKYVIVWQLSAKWIKSSDSASSNSLRTSPFDASAAFELMIS